MSTEIDLKIETILHSVVNRFYKKESEVGLDLEDLRCLDIVCNIRKEADPVSPIAGEDGKETDPDLLAQLVKRARAIKNDSNAR